MSSRCRPTTDGPLPPDVIGIGLPSQPHRWAPSACQHRTIADVGMKTLMRLALRLYPDAWRRRYGPRSNSSSRTGARARPISSISWCMRHRRRPCSKRGFEDERTSRRPPHAPGACRTPSWSPTAVLVGIAVLKYILGVPGPFDSSTDRDADRDAPHRGDDLRARPVCGVRPRRRAIHPLAPGFHDRRLAASAEASVPRKPARRRPQRGIIVFMGLPGWLRTSDPPGTVQAAGGLGGRPGWTQGAGF